MASGTRIVPMLVQSCLDAFLAAVVEVKDSLRASPRVLSRDFSSRPTSRLSLALVPLVVRSAPPMLEDFPSRHMAVLPFDSLESAARPASHLFFRAHVPFVFIYIYCGDRAWRAYPSFCYISTSLRLYIIVSTSAVVFVLLDSFTF